RPFDAPGPGMTATTEAHDRGRDDRGRPFDAPGPGMSATVEAAPAGASNGSAFAFPQLPPEPPSPVRMPAPRSQAAVANPAEQAESIVNGALAEAERIREVARAEGYEAGKRAASVEATERFEAAFAAIGEAL